MLKHEIKTLTFVLLGLVVLPFLLQAGGLTVTSAIECVLLAVVGLGLNVLLGNTGLVSFGHGAWFGIGAYAVAIFQLRFFPNSIVEPLLICVVLVALAAV
ncbi:MAG TPA: ABC transporter, partial [Alcaligenaceae bacterium]|nr:ABC transporter [Alcaligenaceae bacterium]